MLIVMSMRVDELRKPRKWLLVLLVSWKWLQVLTILGSAKSRGQTI